MKVQATIIGKKPNLALPHRRLVCYCRLYEVSFLQFMSFVLYGFLSSFPFKGTRFKSKRTARRASA